MVNGRNKKHLQDAIANNQLTLFYQPIRRLDNCELVGYEALLRWRDSGLGPEEFIPLAQNSPLMGELNQFVINAAAEQISKLSPDLWVSINLSEFNVTEMIATAIAREGIERCRLGIEVLESAQIDNAIAAEIATLKLLGHKIKIDDFGTQHSNLARLQGVPCNELKIDRTFVTGVATNPRKQMVCSASLGMAKVFGLGAIAEGIETDADWHWMLSHGCEYGQGYHPRLGKPMDLN